MGLCSARSASATTSTSPPSTCRSCAGPLAPTKIYDSFPTISPDEAADSLCEAIRAKPKQINTPLGTFGEVAYALMPKAVDQILSTAYKVFPDSAAAKGEKDPGERASTQVALAHLMRGVHW